MSIKSYLVRTGRFAGMYHVRGYKAGRYFHIGRFKTREEAFVAIDKARAEYAV